MQDCFWLFHLYYCSIGLRVKKAINMSFLFPSLLRLGNGKDILNE